MKDFFGNEDFPSWWFQRRHFPYSLHPLPFMEISYTAMFRNDAAGYARFAEVLHGIDQRFNRVMERKRRMRNG